MAEWTYRPDSLPFSGFGCFVIEDIGSVICFMKVPDRLKLFQIYTCIWDLHRIFTFFAITHPILANSVFSRHSFIDCNAGKEICAGNTSVPDLDLATPAQGRNCGILPQAGGLPS